MSNRRRPSPNAPGGSMGDVIEDMAEKGHLNARQREAAALFLAALQAHHGSSQGIVGSTSDKVDCTLQLPCWPPGGGVPVDACERLLKGLRGHERELLKFLVTHRELPRGSLADWGRQHSNYKTGKTQLAVTVGRVTAMLDSIAEICLPKMA